MTPYVQRVEQLQMAMMFEGRPHLRRWFERVKERPSFATAMVRWFNPDYLTLSEREGRANAGLIADMLAGG